MQNIQTCINFENSLKRQYKIMISSTTTFHTEFLFIEKFFRKGVIKKLGKMIKYQ